MGWRSDNLRDAPRWITPDMVQRVLDVAMPLGHSIAPVVAIQTRGVKPTLRIVESQSNPPEEHARRAEESEAAASAPHAASPPRAPNWTVAEDDRLRQAYATGERVDLLAAELCRTVKATYSRAKRLGLAHPRDIKGGFVTKPTWSEEEDQLLRELYGEIPTRELPTRIGRSLRSIYSRAFELDLKHGYQRQWTRSELKAMRIAHQRGLAVADLAKALGRKAFSVSKYASAHGYSFGRRPLLASAITLDGILALERPGTPQPPYRDRAAEVAAAREADRIQRRRDAERRGREIEARRAQAKAERAFAREVLKEAAQRNREVERAAACRPAVPSPSREPAVRAKKPAEPRQPVARQPRAPSNARRSAAMKRSIERQAAALIDGNDSVRSRGGQVNQAVAAAAIAIRERRAAEARQADPVERAKLTLQRRYAPVCSMAVYDGDPDLFMVGHRRNLTRDELLELAARVAA